MKRFNEAMLDGSKYAAEEKIDGCHYLLIENRFFSTRISVRTLVPVEKTANLPHLVEAFEALNMDDLILDGEIVIPGGKSQDVVAITGSLPDLAIQKQEDSGYLHYRVFDMLRAPRGNWITSLSWLDRRSLLEELLSYIDSPYIHLSEAVWLDKGSFLDHILNRGGEGIVLKHADRIYYPGKKPMWNWIKVKVESTDDAVIMGFEPPTILYTGKELETWPYWTIVNGINQPVTKYFYHGWVGAAVLGKYNEDGELIRVGTCSGFDEALRKAFTEYPKKYVGKVAQIRLMEKTPDGAYRHPAFVALHSDKNSKECVLSN